VGFEIRGVESLREHYVLTLRRWVKHFQEHTSELLQTVSERTLRTWLLYMAGSAAAFERGDISLCQVLLRRRSHEHNTELCSRENWYVNSQSQQTNLLHDGGPTHVRAREAFLCPVIATTPQQLKY
jgi:cyclopropane-fatty-acyl-phospholipid synthase